jgi:hypothetical protein
MVQSDSCRAEFIRLATSNSGVVYTFDMLGKNEGVYISLGSGLEI